MKSVRMLAIIALISAVLIPLVLYQPIAVAAANASASEARRLSSISEIPIDVERLKDMVPKTPDEAESAIAPVRNRFLMWTHDGKHIMWGYYGNGYFKGTDNLGKHAWGIYGKGIFAGFYDGEFFWGRYRNGHWKAIDLFGEKETHGRYVLFPGVVPVPASTESSP